MRSSPAFSSYLVILENFDWLFALSKNSNMTMVIQSAIPSISGWLSTIQIIVYANLTNVMPRINF